MKYDMRELQHFFNNVTIRLSIYGWRLRFIPDSSEGYCWSSSKIIDLGEKCKEPKELLLHEIAHGMTCRFCNNPHNFDFWKVVDDLIRRFLPGHKYSKSMMIHRSFAGQGIYGIIYEVDDFLELAK